MSEPLQPAHPENQTESLLEEKETHWGAELSFRLDSDITLKARTVQRLQSILRKASPRKRKQILRRIQRKHGNQVLRSIVQPGTDPFDRVNLQAPNIKSSENTGASIEPNPILPKGEPLKRLLKKEGSPKVIQKKFTIHFDTNYEFKDSLGKQIISWLTDKMGSFSAQKDPEKIAQQVMDQIAKNHDISKWPALIKDKSYKYRIKVTITGGSPKIEVDLLSPKITSSAGKTGSTDSDSAIPEEEDLEKSSVEIKIKKKKYKMGFNQAAEFIENWTLAGQETYSAFMKEKMGQSDFHVIETPAYVIHYWAEVLGNTNPPASSEWEKVISENNKARLYMLKAKEATDKKMKKIYSKQAKLSLTLAVNDYNSVIDKWHLYLEKVDKGASTAVTTCKITMAIVSAPVGAGEGLFTAALMEGGATLAQQVFEELGDLQLGEKFDWKKVLMNTALSLYSELLFGALSDLFFENLNQMAVEKGLEEIDYNKFQVFATKYIPEVANNIFQTIISNTLETLMKSKKKPTREELVKEIALGFVEALPDAFFELLAQ